LKNTTEFIKKTRDGIRKNPASEENKNNNKLLMEVMKTISDMKDVEPKSDSVI